MFLFLWVPCLSSSALGTSVGVPRLSSPGALALFFHSGFATLACPFPALVKFTGCFWPMCLFLAVFSCGVGLITTSFVCLFYLPGHAALPVYTGSGEGWYTLQERVKKSRKSSQRLGYLKKRNKQPRASDQDFLNFLAPSSPSCIHIIEPML